MWVYAGRTIDYIKKNKKESNEDNTKSLMDWWCSCFQFPFELLEIRILRR